MDLNLSIPKKLADEFLIMLEDCEDANTKLLKWLDAIESPDCRDFFKSIITRLNILASNFSKIKSEIIHYEKSNAITILAGGIAHEFNNLLAGISGYLESQTLELNLNSAGREISDKISGLIARAENIVSRLLNLTKTGAPEKKFFLAETEIDGLLDLFNYRLKAAGITVIRDYSNDKELFFDISDFVSIISNLLINSIDALSTGGQIIIKTNNDAFFYYLSWWDSGIGIEKDKLDNIFTPFFTTKICSSKSKSGAGLGLSIVKKIILDNNGEIQVFSEKNRFTEFKIKLPLTDELAVKHKNLTDAQDAKYYKITPEYSIVKSVVFIDETNRPENYIIKDLLRNNNIKIFDNFCDIPNSNIIIIDSASKCERRQLSNKTLIVLFDSIDVLKEYLQLYNRFYFLVKPLKFAEILALKDFILQIGSADLPEYKLVE